MRNVVAYFCGTFLTTAVLELLLSLDLIPAMVRNLPLEDDIVIGPSTLVSVKKADMIFFGGGLGMVDKFQLDLSNLFAAVQIAMIGVRSRVPLSEL